MLKLIDESVFEAPERAGRQRIRPLEVADIEERLPRMVGQSVAMRRLSHVVRRVAKLNVPVLVRGESGSGKELAARALHALSGRANGPWVAINGAGLNETLASSALFGHVRGAFTGAMGARQGALRQAHEGTLFIDEVGAIPSGTQALLLRTLEDFIVRPVGSDEGCPVDVRIVTATCHDLEEQVRSGQFRADLYQRIAACVVTVPPLRERADDLPALAAHVLARTLPDTTLTDDAVQALADYAFPGNVRELKNVLVQAAVHGDGRLIRCGDIVSVLRARCHVVAPCEAAQHHPAQHHPAQHHPAQHHPPPRRRDGIDWAPPPSTENLLEVLVACGGNVSRAARRVGLPRSTFRDRVRRARSQKVPTRPAPCVSGVMIGTGIRDPVRPEPLSSESRK